MKTHPFAAARPLMLGLCVGLGLLASSMGAMAAEPAAKTAQATPLKPAGAGAGAGASLASPSAIRRAFERGDLNHDGFISLEEFRKDMLQSWHALDLDQDGFISREELLAAGGRKQAERVLRALHHYDHDGDQRLSFKEVIGARMAGFDAADLNHDDQLSLQEVLDYELQAGQRLLTAGLPKAKKIEKIEQGKKSK